VDQLRPTSAACCCCCCCPLQLYFCELLYKLFNTANNSAATYVQAVQLNTDNLRQHSCTDNFERYNCETTASLAAAAQAPPSPVHQAWRGLPERALSQCNKHWARTCVPPAELDCSPVGKGAMLLELAPGASHPQVGL
jgi:hypothetical protein